MHLIPLVLLAYYSAMFGFFKHYLFPHRGNNHRAKILHHSSLIVIIAVLFFASALTIFIKKTNPEVLGISYSISAGELINLVNQQRQSGGLSPLTENSALDDAARRKAADMLSKNYWAHFAPDGSTSPWTFIKDSGYAYIYAGENLAKGFTDPGSIVNAWMNSQTHRDNIMSDKYREVGFAIVPGTLQGEETVLVVQMFGTRNQDTVAVAQAEEPAAATQLPAPTVIVVAKATITPTSIPAQIASANASPSTTVEAKPIINANFTTKALSSVGLSILGVALVMDLVIVERKKIPRIVGHNIDHVILIALFLLFVVLKTSGVIL